MSTRRRTRCEAVVSWHEKPEKRTLDCRPRFSNQGWLAFKRPEEMISCPFWQYSDPYSSPYFVPSQEPAFGPVSYLRTRFGSQDAVSDPSPSAHYFRISSLPLILFPLAPPTRRLNHPISTFSLTRSFRAPSPLSKHDFQCPDYRLSVATRDFLFRTDRFSRSLRLAPFPFPRRDFPMSIPPS